MKLSCTSVMLPRWDLNETFDRLAEFGYDGVELRCRPNPQDPDAEPFFWGRHRADISPDNVVARAPEIREAAARTGLKVVALAPQATLGQDDLIEKLFAGALAIDSEHPPMIRIGAERHDRSKPYHPQFLAARAGFAALVEKARERGIKILYEIHVGTVAVTASRAYELLRDLDPDHIGAIYDVPNMLRTGLEDTRMGMEILGPYLAHCHIGNGTPVAGERDETGAVPWKWEFSGLREGAAPIARIVADLTGVGYTGFLSLEDFGPGDDTEKVRDQGGYLRQLMNP